MTLLKMLWKWKRSTRLSVFMMPQERWSSQPPVLSTISCQIDWKIAWKNLFSRRSRDDSDSMKVFWSPTLEEENEILSISKSLFPSQNTQIFFEGFGGKISFYLQSLLEFPFFSLGVWPGVC